MRYMGGRLYAVFPLAAWLTASGPCIVQSGVLLDYCSSFLHLFAAHLNHFTHHSYSYLALIP